MECLSSLLTEYIGTALRYVYNLVSINLKNNLIIREVKWTGRKDGIWNLINGTTVRLQAAWQRQELQRQPSIPRSHILAGKGEQWITDLYQQLSFHYLSGFGPLFIILRQCNIGLQDSQVRCEAERFKSNVEKTSEKGLLIYDRLKQSQWPKSSSLLCNKQVVVKAKNYSYSSDPTKESRRGELSLLSETHAQLCSCRGKLLWCRSNWPIF